MGASDVITSTTCEKEKVIEEAVDEGGQRLCATEPRVSAVLDPFAGGGALDCWHPITYQHMNDPTYDKRDDATVECGAALFGPPTAFVDLERSRRKIRRLRAIPNK